ncbi:MAG: nuclear transport factor 2 family protein [Proteobacteria bacterium]|nr:nuclear transport factor 2 family protein [Pseudomonadota bacterium]
MSLLEKFVSQRAAFEAALRDDDWSRVEPYLHADVRYEVLNMPFHCSLRGRDSVISGLRRSINRFDRLCERSIGGSPILLEEGDSVLVHGSIRFRRGESPVLESRLWEIATYKGDAIERLIDLYDVGEAQKFTRWMAEWGAGLDASYT